MRFAVFITYILIAAFVACAGFIFTHNALGAKLFEPAVHCRSLNAGGKRLRQLVGGKMLFRIGGNILYHSRILFCDISHIITENKYE